MPPPIHRRQLMLGAATLAMPWLAQAQTGWPIKPVNLIVPFPAGGGTDAFARPMASQFSKLTGKTLVIDNRGGAGGTLGSAKVAKASPDGYTLLLHHIGMATSPALYRNMPYKTLDDFE